MTLAEWLDTQEIIYKPFRIGASNEYQLMVSCRGSQHLRFRQMFSDTIDVKTALGMLLTFYHQAGTLDNTFRPMFGEAGIAEIQAILTTP